LGWGLPRLEVRRLPSRTTTGDRLSPTPLLFFALSPLSLLPLPFSLCPPLSSALRPFPTPRLSISAARAPFPYTSAAAGSHITSPPPPARPRNHRILWCFLAASASAAGRPLAALPAAIRTSLSAAEADHR
ncbi:hypothetical protein U9M48_016917, partial [Paspalum notatum var. saurae]